MDKNKKDECVKKIMNSLVEANLNTYEGVGILECIKQDLINWSNKLR